MTRTPPVTDAEWEVMNVLWDESPRTANDVIETLSERMKWHATTVKTLLSRLVKKGVVPTMRDAFNQYLAPGGKAYFDKERLTPRDAITRIRQSGGVAVCAHPVQLRTTNDAQLEQLLKDLTDLGLEGLEVLHSDHTPALVEKYTSLADKYTLLKSGGSDFHGANKKDIPLGLANGRQIPRAWMDAIIERSATRPRSP